MAKNRKDAKLGDVKDSIVIIGDNNTIKESLPIITPARIFVFIASLVIVAAAGLLAYSFMPAPTTKAPENVNTNSSPTSTPKSPVETYQIEITSRMITTIKLEKDDRAMISAEGQIRLGPFAGIGGPDGVPGFTRYNMLRDDRHGALFARIKDDDEEEQWKRIGKQGPLPAKHPGVLEFLVNDIEPDNNQGSFHVTVQVYRKK
jgi:hypothetical protein